MKGQLRFRVKVNQKVLGTVIANSSVKSAYEDALLEVAGNLQAETPVGATGRLKAGWDVDLEQVLIGSSVQFVAKIVNRAEYAQFGIIGRGPGKMPPLQPIIDWVAAKGSPDPERDAWRVRVAIARRGTVRWRKGDNWVGLNRDGTIKPDSPLHRLKERLSANLKRR